MYREICIGSDAQEEKKIYKSNERQKIFLFLKEIRVRGEQNDDEATISPSPPFHPRPPLGVLLPISCQRFPSLFRVRFLSELISPLCASGAEGFTDTARMHRRPHRRFELLANLSGRVLSRVFRLW